MTPPKHATRKRKLSGARATRSRRCGPTPREEMPTRNTGRPPNSDTSGPRATTSREATKAARARRGQRPDETNRATFMSRRPSNATARVGQHTPSPRTNPPAKPRTMARAKGRTQPTTRAPAPTPQQRQRRRAPGPTSPAAARSHQPDMATGNKVGPRAARRRSWQPQQGQSRRNTPPHPAEPEHARKEPEHARSG